MNDPNETGQPSGQPQAIAQQDSAAHLETYAHIPYAPPADGLGREPKAPLPKVFYKLATVLETATGFVVQLDGRTIKTPKKSVLYVPSRALADHIAAEWQAQSIDIDPETMPLTRLANTTLDAVIANIDAVRADIVDYAGSDALCYRADAPATLVARQAANWDPIITWAHREFGAHLVARTGIVHVPQSPEALAAISRAIAPFSPWQIAPLHVMTTITGSALLALAVANRAVDLDAAWTAAHIDEDWQIETWGTDAEALVRRERRWRDMKAASQMLETFF
jgi:chaperone required for assembly of F1-ATPase